ncbi:hypothetical protein TGDOM2_261370 [Toxoplasma gondii GAB2-2007-GAL-DOM2]|uniref:F-box domain-containing protein n=4 Tax=Toxoplasma gondii TaxID=5811 RepID=A0A086L7Z6_TOXGO|nr:hypothetical protein TGDOM2_261370 [Toxoplasma gondii GAB2-2007-GAL-DOM2]KFG52764.1 hypothetical protein TGFOU_261370 [Toxoplasma gondii FOU]
MQRPALRDPPREGRLPPRSFPPCNDDPFSSGGEGREEEGGDCSSLLSEESAVPFYPALSTAAPESSSASLSPLPNCSPTTQPAEANAESRGGSFVSLRDLSYSGENSEASATHTDLATLGSSGFSWDPSEPVRVCRKLPRHVGRAPAVSVLDQSGFGEDDGAPEGDRAFRREERRVRGERGDASRRSEAPGFDRDDAAALRGREAGETSQRERRRGLSPSTRETETRGSERGEAGREATSYSFDFDRFLEEEASAEPEGEDDFFEMLRDTPTQMEVASEAVHRLSAFLLPSDDESDGDVFRTSHALDTTFPLSSPSQLSSASLLLGRGRESLSENALPPPDTAVSGDDGTALTSPFSSLPASSGLPATRDSCSCVMRGDAPSHRFPSSRETEMTVETLDARETSFGSRSRAYGSGKPVASLHLRGDDSELLLQDKSDKPSVLAVSQESLSGAESQPSRSPPRKKAYTHHEETTKEAKARMLVGLPSPFSSPRNSTYLDTHERQQPSRSAPASCFFSSGPTSRSRSFRREGTEDSLSLEPVQLATTWSSPCPTLREQIRSQPSRSFLSASRDRSSSPHIERHHTRLLRDACVSSPSLSPQTRGNSWVLSARSRMRERAQQATQRSSPPAPLSPSSPPSPSRQVPESFCRGPAAASRSKERGEYRDGEREAYSSLHRLRVAIESPGVSEGELASSRRSEREERRKDARPKTRFSSPSQSAALSLCRSRSSTLGSRQNEGEESEAPSPLPQGLGASPYPLFFSPSLAAPFELESTRTPPKRSSRLSEKESFFSVRKTSPEDAGSLLSGRVGKRTRPRDSPRETDSKFSTRAAAEGPEGEGVEGSVSLDSLRSAQELDSSSLSAPSRWQEAKAAAAVPAEERFENACSRESPAGRHACSFYPVVTENLEERQVGSSAFGQLPRVPRPESTRSRKASSTDSPKPLRWTSVPAEVLSTLCQFLAVEDLVAFQRLDRRAYAVGSHATVWRALCMNEWVKEQPAPQRRRDREEEGEQGERSGDTRVTGSNLGGEPAGAGEQGEEAQPEQPQSTSTDAGEREEEMAESTSSEMAPRGDAAEREHFQRVWEMFARGVEEEKEEHKEAVVEPWRARNGKSTLHFRAGEGDAHAQTRCGLRPGQEGVQTDACMQSEREVKALEMRRSRWLNAHAYRNDYRRLYRDGNGWFPCSSSQGADPSSDSFSWSTPRFSTAKMKLNPHLSNSMDTREDAAEILIASEGVETPGGQRSSYIRVIDRESLQVVHEQQIPTRSLNCLDICPELYACGDDSGTIRLFSRRTHSLLHRYTSVGVVNMMAMYGLGPSQEVNDLRICRAEQQIVSVRTASRYPAGIEVVDLHTGKTTAITPGKTNGNWIHALDVEQDLSLDFPSFRPARRSLLFSPDSAAASYSPPWRRSSITSLVAVGESSSAGCFSLLRLDLRCGRPVVQEIPQTRRMLWPLRVQGTNVFVNSVFAANEMCGRVRQIDLRAPSPDICAQQHTSVTCLAEEGSKRIGSCMVHLLPSRKVEDIRVMGDFLYALTDDADGCLQMLRFDTKRDSKAQLVAVVDVFDSSEWTEPLRLLQVNPQGWTCTYGNFVKFGRIADPEEPRWGGSEISLASPLSLSAIDSRSG